MFAAFQIPFLPFVPFEPKKATSYLRSAEAYVKPAVRAVGLMHFTTGRYDDDIL